MAAPDEPLPRPLPAAGRGDELGSMLRRIAADQGSAADHDLLRDLVQAGRVAFVPDAEAGGARLIVTDERGEVMLEMSGGARIAALRAAVAQVAPKPAPPPARPDM